MASDTFYLWKRKIKAAIQSLPFYLWRLRPIQKNKMVFTTIEGTTGFSPAIRNTSRSSFCGEAKAMNSSGSSTT